jgi:hypothetical protein
MPESITPPRRLSLFRPRLIIVGILVVLAIVLSVTRFDFSGEFSGIYLLSGLNGSLLEIKDDIFLGEYERVIAKIEFVGLYRLFHREEGGGTGPYLSYKWNSTRGHGFVKSMFPDGTSVLTCFGRYLDSDNKASHGLFVGGGLPYSYYKDSTVTMNETGMAFNNGHDWFHLWCNVNEAISPASAPEKLIYPSAWKFLGSRILFANRRKLVLQSSHEITLDGVPLHIDRYAIFHAGDRHFVLAINITNRGEKPAEYYYVYGDEPWVGDYGTSTGNVGWTRDKLYLYESAIDPSRESYAGMFDFGNRIVPGENSREFSGLANFIEWLGTPRPDVVYFSNKEGSFANEEEKVPLYSRTNRVMFLQWGPRVIQPGQSELLTMAVGMADRNPQTGFPVKPETAGEVNDLVRVLQGRHVD